MTFSSFDYFWPNTIATLGSPDFVNNRAERYNGRQKDIQRDRRTDRQTDRQTDRKIGMVWYGIVEFNVPLNTV